LSGLGRKGNEGELEGIGIERTDCRKEGGKRIRGVKRNQGLEEKRKIIRGV